MLTRILILTLILINAKCVIAQYDSITITYRDLSFHKKNRANFRLHSYYTQDGQFGLASIDSYKLPRNFKKFKVTGSENHLRFSFSRTDAFQYAIPRFDSLVAQLYADRVYFTDRKKKEALKKTYERNAARYFSGKYAGSFFKYNWTPLYAIPVSRKDSLVTIEVKGNLFKKAQYKTDKLPIGFASELPALDPWACESLNRFHELRKMRGYGIGKIKYIPYRMQDRKSVSEQFELYFDKNSSTPRVESVQAVIDYLKNNNYTILNATIEGYSSIEGDDQRNTLLQQKRANLLFKLLQKHNSEPIIRDTVIINPGYDLFRQTIKHTPYQWLDSLSNEKMRATINSNYILLSAVESFLKPQRKAVLKLIVAKRIEGAEVLERFKRAFSFLEKQLDPKTDKGLQQADLEARVMGMIAYLQTLLENKFISSDEMAEIIDNSKNKEIIRVLTVYHQIIQFENKSNRDSLAWSNQSSQYGYNEYFTIAQSNLIGLINEAKSEKLKSKFKQQLVDIQTYSFDYALMHWISPTTLCELDYPDNLNFRSYKLNQLAFLHYLSGFQDVPCERLQIPDKPALKKYSDDWLDEVQRSNKRSESNALIPEGKRVVETEFAGFSPVLFAKPDRMYYPSYGKEVYSPLLFYLKKLFVKDEKSIRQYMQVSDNLTAFDIYILAYYHVNEWDPHTNYFADEEVQLMGMDRIIGLLKRGDSRICSPQVNQLYLDYHLKALHYINLYFEPGNEKQVAIAQRSLQFITNYYSKRAEMVTPKLSMYILLQLNAFHLIPGKYDGTCYAWKLLKCIAAKRALSEDEMFLYKKYAVYYESK